MGKKTIKLQTKHTSFWRTLVKDAAHGIGAGLAFGGIVALFIKISDWVSR